jgi:hypothetical protein
MVQIRPAMRNCLHQILAAAGLFALAFALPVELRAEDAETEGRKFNFRDIVFRVGWYSISSNTVVRLDGNNGNLGTTLSLENDLNLDDEKSTFYGAIGWRLSGRHYMEVEHFRLARSGLQTLTAEIKFGDDVFEIGAKVDSYFDTRVTRVSYAYLVHDSRKYAVALSAGLHLTDLSMGITELSTQFAVENVEIAEVTVPLPVIGVTGAWRINDKWFLFGRAQVFRLEIADYKGHLDHFSAKLEYSAFKHFGIGVGFDVFDLKLDVNKRLWNGTVDFEFRGPIVYLSGTF